MTEPQAKSRNPLIQVLIPILVILGLVVGGLFAVKKALGPSRPRVEHVEIQVGKILPDFVLKRFGPGQIQASALQSKVIMINFWATWCEACMVEMPSIVRLQHHYAAKGFAVIPINVDDNPETVLPSTLKKLGIDFPVYIDEGQKLAETFDVHAIPLTVIIDKNLKVLFIESGERNWNGDDFHADLEKWLAS